MKTIKLDQIIIPENRQRALISDDYIGELVGSLFSDTGAGMLNPVILRDGNVLVAGECRTRAIKLGYLMGKSLRHAGEVVPAGHVPYIDFGALDPLARMEAEYAENAVRNDLTWQDNVKAIAALDALRSVQARVEGIPHTTRDTAQELFKSKDGYNADKVAKAIILAASMSDKDIAGAKSYKEAKKILLKKNDAAQRVALAKLTGKVAVSDRMECFNTNCLDWMKEQPGDQFDVILTDPPYGMGADNFGDAAGKLAGTEHNYEDGEEPTKRLLAAAIPEFFRLAKPEAHLYLWCDLDLFHWLRNQCRAAGWWTFRTPLVNVKPEGGRVPWPEHGPRRAYELCLYAVKGKKPVNAIVSDVFESRLTEGNFGHGAQKPVEAYVNLLKRSVRPGNKVFDAFAGTGTIFAAAAQVDCYAVGCELEEAAFGICVQRIGGLK